MIDNNYNFTCTAYEKMNEKGDSLNKVFKPKKKADYNRILLDCPVGNSTVMYNVSNLGKFKCLIYEKEMMMRYGFKS